MKRVFVLGALLVGVSPAGCDGPDCTLVACGQPVLHVDLQRPAWTEGDYKVTVIADGETVECAATLPLRCDAPASCPASSGVTWRNCGLIAAEQDLAYVELRPGRAPKSVLVRVQQGDALLGEATYTPAYRESTPNGPECTPTCFTSDGVVLELQ